MSTPSSFAPPAAHVATLPEAFQLTSAAHADEPAIRTKGDALVWTWRDYSERVRAMAAGLNGAGVGAGDTVGIMLTNRPEFHVVDTGAAHLGAAPFSIYSTFPVAQVAELLRNSGCPIVVTEQEFLPVVREAAAEVGGRMVVVVDGDAPDGVLSWDDLLALARDDFDFDAAWRAVAPGDILTIIYTSGTTGAPKGVEITHANMMATLNGYLTALHFPAEGRVLSWLPMAHVAERGCSHYLPMVLGYTSTSCPDSTQMLAYLQEVRPTWFFAVPRAWEKLRAGVQGVMAREPDEAKKQATAWALAAGTARMRAKQAGDVPAEVEAEYQKADELVLSKLRVAIGLDRLAVVNAGAAPSSREVMEFFHSIGIPVGDLWGMSESCAAGCVNRPGEERIGTVGPALPGFEVTVADDGELLLRGPGIMRGYRGDPELTAATIDADGWLHTGDVGSMDDDGFVTIVDRKKEIAITSSGKNLAPARVESIVKGASPLIGQVVAVADGRRYVVALVTIDQQMLGAIAAARGLDLSDLLPVEQSPVVNAMVSAAIDKANEDLARYEQVKAFRIMHEDWLPGGDELTPTMKLKRRNVLEKYGVEIDELYADADRREGQS